MKRFSIMAVEYPHHGSEVEVCQVDANPDAVVAALERKRWSGCRTLMWARVRVVNNQPVEGQHHD
jgi:hypothetical protein